MPKELDLGRVVGKDATINGQNAINLIAGKDINIVQDGENVTIGVSDDLNAVPKERTINNKSLSEDILITASDVNAVPLDRTVNGKTLDKNISLNSSDVGAVPVERTINGKSLSANVTLTHTDVGAAPTSHGTHVTYATTSPKMDGTASVGTDSKLARADHVHPSDTTKQDKLTGTPDQYVTFDENGNAVAKQKDYSLFGFQIDPDESDPSKKIKYIAQNASYDPAFMDYEKDEFNYGDWANAWFIKNIKSVMMKFDGTVAYELNKNDYTKKADGTASDVTNDNYAGNVMVGIPTVWIRHTVLNGKDTFYFSDQKLSDDFHAYAHTAADGSIMSYTYLAAYNGWKDNNGNMRSLSSKTPTTSETFPNQIEQARANNPEGKHMWDIDTFVDRNLINLLLLLIGKSTNTQDVFGSGNLNGLNYPVEGAGEYGILQTGTMDTKGLFYGFHNSNNGVKVFGIENWWGNVSRRAQGLILNSLYYKIKLTYGTEDGSTCEGYNLTGDGYIDADIKCPNNNGGYIKLMAVKNGILLPFTTGGSASTYYCDSLYVTTYRSINFPTFGGYSYTGFQGGAFIFNFTHEASSSPYYIGVCLSCKPY